LQNQYQETCYLVMAYAPAFPGADAAQDVKKWLETGAPAGLDHGAE
jgi:hypothetical protein